MPELCGASVKRPAGGNFFGDDQAALLVHQPNVLFPGFQHGRFAGFGILDSGVLHDAAVGIELKVLDARTTTGFLRRTIGVVEIFGWGKALLRSCLACFLAGGAFFPRPGLRRRALASARGPNPPDTCLLYTSPSPRD